MSLAALYGNATATGKHIHCAGGLQPAVDASGAVEQRHLCAYERWLCTRLRGEHAILRP